MKKTVLKEAITISVVMMLILSTIVIAEIGELDHDVGVSEILSPTSGPLQIYDVEVKVKNYGSNFETTDVYVEIIELAGGTGVYADLAEDVSIAAGEEELVSFLDWTPSETGGYEVTACTLLYDEDPSNNCLTKTILIFEGDRTTGYRNWWTFVDEGSAAVNVANGNLIVPRTDLSIDARIDSEDCKACEISFELVYPSSKSQ